MTRGSAPGSPAANAQGADFPIQNLPYGVFSTGELAPRCGIAIGDRILDLAAIEAAGPAAVRLRAVFDRPALNDVLGARPRSLAEDAAPGLAAASRGGERAARRRRTLRPSTRADRRGAAAPADLRAQLHRFLCLAAPCRERRHDVPRPGECAAAELAAHADRLQRPRLDRGGLGPADPAAAGPAQGSRTTRRRALAPPPGSTSSSSSARSSASRARWGARSPPPRPRQ